MTEGRRVKSAEYQPPERDYGEVKNLQRVPVEPFVWWRSQLVLMVIVFALLLAGAVLWTLLTPPATPLMSEQVQGSDGSERSNAGASPINTDPTPWQTQQSQAARAQAQDVLAQLIALKTSLQAADVQTWAPTDFSAALAQADAGDEDYAIQQFEPALEHYQSALESFEALDQQIPEVVEAYVESAYAAIEERKLDLAREALGKALKLDANSISALTALARLDGLPEALAHIDAAVLAEQQFAQTQDTTLLQSAIQDYQAAIAIDPLLTRASASLEAAQTTLLEHRFDQAMSTALNALMENRYSAAQSAFSKALDFANQLDVSDSPEYQLAQRGLDQALALNQGSSINGLFAQAKQAERSENWQQAASVYQAILNRDASQIRARSSLVQARIRADLDSQLKRYLADPLSFTKDQDRAAIQQLLADAKGIRRGGEVLAQQIAQAEALLNGAQQQIRVELVSDQATTIYLLKRGAKPIRYAPFENKSLSLKPGKYTLVGQRVGYQDVRKELVLEPGSRQATRLDIRSGSILDSASLAEKEL